MTGSVIDLIIWVALAVSFWGVVFLAVRQERREDES